MGKDSPAPLPAPLQKQATAPPEEITAFKHLLPVRRVGALANRWMDTQNGNCHRLTTFHTALPSFSASIISPYR
ncbi:hypothetical protein DESC_100035 [Desulfosarcina cetonica]|nr:hypothetical protein DESC_100035 [Desulfosarcina cetonica]